jgi:hypothetical protein
MVLTAIVFDRVFKEPAALAWLTGFFTFIGFIIHLVLDEIYSVDIEGAELKRSFGTALKVFDYHSLGASALMAVAFAAAIAIAPSPRDFEEIVRAPALVQLLKGRLLPKGKWFDTQTEGTSASSSGRPERDANTAQAVAAEPGSHLR